MTALSCHCERSEANLGATSIDPLARGVGAEKGIECAKVKR